MNYTVIKSIDDEDLYLKIYNIESPKACVQIVHGMQEHQTRYESLALFLNEQGYTVVTSDLRGHGENAKEHGFFKEKDGYKVLISDQVCITNYIKNTLGIEKVIIYGHSMGSIITRDVIQANSNLYTKVILSGFPNYNPLAPVAITISNVVKKVKGNHSYSRLLHKITLGPFEKAIKNKKTDLDWLSLNEENVINYQNDPLCGHEFTNGAYNDLHHLLHLVGKKNKNKVNNLPILLLNGSDDPCVGGVKGTQKSKRILNKQGFTNLKHIEYPNYRHEIFNEKDTTKIYKDFLDFIEA